MGYASRPRAVHELVTVLSWPQSPPRPSGFFEQSKSIAHYALLRKTCATVPLDQRLSQDKLGELAGLNGKYLGEVERGNSNISINNLSKLAEVMEVPLLSLMTINHEKDRDELLKDLHHLLSTADDTQLKIIHRLIEAVTR